jgi:5'-3' exonuclease
MRLHLVDGTFELFRAHFAKRPDRPLKATVGIAQSMLTLLSDQSEAVTHLAVAFDNPIRSFRNDLFAGYKSDEGMDPELRSQFDIAEDAVRALGITVWSMRDFEADDAMATAASRWKGQVEQVRILTPDKDLGQMLDGDRVVQIDVIRKKTIDETTLWERRGVLPKSVPDLLALIGDDADGIPGLPGFGEKTAGVLLQLFVQIEQIPLQASEWPSGIRGAEKLCETLKANLTDALLYKKLATLRVDVPLAEGLPDLLWQGVPRKKLEDFISRVDAPELRERVRRWAAT